MSADVHNRIDADWRSTSRGSPVRLFLSGDPVQHADLFGARAGGDAIDLRLCAVTDWIDPAELDSAMAAVIQVDPDSGASLKRFERLAAQTRTPLIAASYEPPLALVRNLIRVGARDVLPLPLDLGELDTALAPIRAEARADGAMGMARSGRLVAVIRSEGGVGATAIATQLAIGYAAREAAQGRATALVDLDVQFGDAAFQLGLNPSLGLGDLIDAGARIDPALLHSVAETHRGGLAVIAAPADVRPIESFSSDALLAMLETALKSYATVFVDLPATWTNWSLSVLARADLALLVTERKLTALRRARRLLDLMQAQGLGQLPVEIIVNRQHRRSLKTITDRDVERVLGQPIGQTISEDREAIDDAIDRGLPVTHLHRRSPLSRDLESLEALVARDLHREI